MPNSDVQPQAFQIHVFDEVPADVLADPGTSLRAFFPADRNFEFPPHVGDALRVLPESGWRMIQSLDNDRNRRETVAAPSLDEPGAWVLISSSLTEEGRWMVSTTDGWPLHAVPAKRYRRAQLRLDLMETTTAAGTRPNIRPTLTNTSNAMWRNVAEDTPTVLAWLLDADGKPIMTPGVVYSGGVGGLPDLNPGETVELYRADLTTPDIESFPQGEYTVIGLLKDLNLRSEPGLLRIT
ncbi:hypothetical protein [Williamsia maris]|uniref:hypothetical protein n=1 Tax=Williamsia maris TaxID=72806 RepID=UPI0020A2C0F3|nr:hypothetical protein [Williamsia maris]